MTHWEIEAMKREAVQVRNDWTLSDHERAARLSMRATLSPSCAARNVHTYPPGPAPITTTS